MEGLFNINTASNNFLPPAKFTGDSKGLAFNQDPLSQNDSTIQALPSLDRDLAVVEQAQQPLNHLQARPNSQRQALANQVIENHANELKNIFSTASSWQNFLTDIFKTNPNFQQIPAAYLEDFRDDFIEGTHRPNVRFVEADELIGPQQHLRGAAFDQSNQTILLANNLNSAEIEAGIAQELGHWWDTQLNGSVDTTTPNGNPFDEGAAYAERFGEGIRSEGNWGDAIYAPSIYENDHHTVFIEGEETAVEFRPIGSVNMQGANNGDQSTWDYLFSVMNATIPGQNQGIVDLMAIQEGGDIRNAGFGDALIDMGAQTVTTETGIQATVNRFRVNVDGQSFVIFQLLGDLGTTTRNNLAIVLRNPPDGGNTIQSIIRRNPRVPDSLLYDADQRPALGVRIDDRVYFTVHAQAGRAENTGFDNRNDAEDMVRAATQRGLNDGNNVQAVTVLGDFNRNLLFNGFGEDIDPPGGLGNNPAFLTLGSDGHRLIRAQGDTPTHNARTAQPSSILDYAFERRADGGPITTFGAGVLDLLPGANTPAFPSDHFPVLFTDNEADFTNEGTPPITPPVTVAPPVAPPPVAPPPEAPEETTPDNNEEEEEGPSFTSQLPGFDQLQLYVTTGVLRDVDADMEEAQVTVGTGQTINTFVGVALDRNQAYSFYDDGTYRLASVKRLTDLDAQSDGNERLRYITPENKTIVGITSNDEDAKMIAYYDDGTALEADNNPTINFSEGREFTYDLPDDYDYDQVRAIARNEKNEKVVAIFSDGNYSVGTLDDLDALEGVQASDLSSEAAAGLLDAGYDDNNISFFYATVGATSGVLTNSIETEESMSPIGLPVETPVDTPPASGDYDGSTDYPTSGNHRNPGHHKRNNGQRRFWSNRRNNGQRRFWSNNHWR